MISFARDNAECLGQAKTLLQALGADTYTKISNECLDSSIGAHLRHAIEHYQSFANGYADSTINYDTRARDTAIETDPKHALGVLEDLTSFLDSISAHEPDRRLRIKMDCGSDECWTESTTARELQFLLSHAIHHYALISVICRTQQIPIAPGFGIAPSTLRHRRACAP